LVQKNFWDEDGDEGLKQAAWMSLKKWGKQKGVAQHGMGNERAWRQVLLPKGKDRLMCALSVRRQ
jgi:hypothetical protein